MASYYFLNADLNLNPVQHLNISLGWGTVYLEVSVEKPELVSSILALHYAKICSLPQISRVTSDKSFNTFNFFPLSWFICLQVGVL